MVKYDFFLALIINISICNSWFKNLVPLIKGTNFSLTKRNNIREPEGAGCNVNNDYYIYIVTVETPALTRRTAIKLLSRNLLEDTKNWIIIKGN